MKTFLIFVCAVVLDISRYVVIWLNYQYMIRDMFKSLPEVGLLRMIWLLVFFWLCTVNISKKTEQNEPTQIWVNGILQILALLSMLGLYRFFS